MHQILGFQGNGETLKTARYSKGMKKMMQDEI
jgi:hypothetical protein